MTPRELRIGNKLIGNIVYGGKVQTFHRMNDTLDVVFFSDGSIHGIGEFLTDCQPIPLTEEWLLKFGFEDNSYAVFYKTIEKDTCVSVSFQDYAHTCLHDFPITVWPNDYALPIQCKYVHQLQNLWHSLTGEELTIKE